MKKIIIGIVLIIAAFLGYVAMQPADFSITRSLAVNAPAPIVFEQINDFRNWNNWSPWAKLDPNATFTYGGSDKGVGSEFSWAGNKEVGEGKMTIVESKPHELVSIQLDFLKPMESTAKSEFTLAPNNTQTTITWTMSGKNNFMGRLLCTFMNADKVVGGQFEKGLASIKAIVEAPKTK